MSRDRQRPRRLGVRERLRRGPEGVREFFKQFRRTKKPHGKGLKFHGSRVARYFAGQAKHCLSCKGPLRVNHDYQSVKYCSPLCRAIRHNENARHALNVLRRERRVQPQPNVVKRRGKSPSGAQKRRRRQVTK